MTVKELKEHIESFEEAKENHLKAIKKLNENIQEFEEIIKTLEPNFYLNKVYTRNDGTDDQFIIMNHSRLYDYTIRLYNITKCQFVPFNELNCQVIREGHTQTISYDELKKIDPRHTYTAVT